MKKLGRPKKLEPTSETLALIEETAKNLCSKSEAAARLGVHRETFSTFIDTHKKALEAWEQGQEAGRLELREAQMVLAMKGNATMLIWLGKQHLGQSDKQETRHSGDPENPLVTVMKAISDTGPFSGLPNLDKPEDD